MEEIKNRKLLFVIGAIFLLILIIGGAFAYFQIVANNNATSTSISGEGELVGKTTLTTNISTLSLRLTSEMMSWENRYKTYYATETGEGVEMPSLGNGRYNLATVSLSESDTLVDCTYAYDISASSQKAIDDEIARTAQVRIIESNGDFEIYTLSELLEGITHTGEFKNVEYGNNQSIQIEAYVNNTKNLQNDFAGNSFTITITPKSGEEGFSCITSYNLADAAKGEAVATYMINNSNKINYFENNSLQDDGYRYVGTGPNYCNYNNGAYVTTTLEGIEACPSAYHVVETNTTTGEITEYDGDWCPESWGEYTRECTEFSGTLSKGKQPANFICFGTTSIEECTSTEVDEEGLTGIAKYMYRIIGVFPDENGNQHIKLIKYTPLRDMYGYGHDWTENVSWEDSELFQKLNGEYFLDDTAYSYMQNTNWTDKIENWKWTATNSMAYGADGMKSTLEDNGGNYYDGMTPSEIYLHEMNRSTKTKTIGEWANPTAKISLMYVSDYALSLGKDEIANIISADKDFAKLKTGWMHQSNNYGTGDAYEFTMSRSGYNNYEANLYYYDKYVISNDGRIGASESNYPDFMRPVFYLTSNTQFVDGYGTFEQPFIIK